MGGVWEAWLPKSILALRGTTAPPSGTISSPASPSGWSRCRWRWRSRLPPASRRRPASTARSSPGSSISALGGSRVQIGGPTGAFVVVVSGIVAEHGVAGLFMCTMMAGVMLVILGVTGTGTAVRFIPRPVVVGFTNGIAVLIASTQIRDFLGLRMSENPGEFLGRLAAIGRHLDTISPAAVGLGGVTLLLVLGTNRFVKVIPGTVVGLVAGTAVAWRGRSCQSRPWRRVSVACRRACRSSTSQRFDRRSSSRCSHRLSPSPCSARSSR